MLRDGRLHLSGIERLARHLTPANRTMLLKRATHKTKKQNTSEATVISRGKKTVA